MKPAGRPPQLPPVRPGAAGPAKPVQGPNPTPEAAPAPRPGDRLGLDKPGQAAANPLGHVLDRPTTGPEGDEADALFALLDGPTETPDGDPADALGHLAEAPLPDAATQATMGRLAAALAQQGKHLDAATWARLRLTGPFARAFMAPLRALSPRARAAALGGVPVDVRRSLIDALGTDDDDLPDNAELVASLAAADPELAAEVLAWAGAALAKAVAARPRDPDEGAP